MVKFGEGCRDVVKRKAPNTIFPSELFLMCAITKTVLSNAEDVADEMLRKHVASRNIFQHSRHGHCAH